eukprot:10192465-Heterocapsa_arctica.AAC.1
MSLLTMSPRLARADFCHKWLMSRAGLPNVQRGRLRLSVMQSSLRILRKLWRPKQARAANIFGSIGDRGFAVDTARAILDDRVA